MKNNPKKSVSPAVMQQIQTGTVSMRSRRYFVLLSAFSVAGMALTGLLVSYLLSVVFFWVRIETSGTMAWGARENLSEALGSFPWWALPLAVGAFTITVLLVRRHGAMYRHKTVTIVALLAMLSLLVGAGLSFMGVGGIHSGEQRDDTVRMQRGNQSFDASGQNRS